jgi:predicted Zn-dependent peptidase
MPSRGFVQSEVWYKVGSKDEKPGIYGIAHMCEHMMFRGSKKYPGSLINRIEQSGIPGFDAYTDFDRTVYWEYAPVDYLDTIMDIESDRMANLVITQDLLNIEREAVAEEYSNGLNTWYERMNDERYKFLYPQGHPYKEDVIGEYSDIESFTAEECKSFYDSYYSPNNAFLVIAGDVKSDAVFAMAEKYFGPITKQLSLKKRTDIPDIYSNKIEKNEMGIDYPIQIYSYVYPKPEAGNKDTKALNMLISLLFTDENSIINERIVDKEKLAYGINNYSQGEMLFPSYGIIDVFMGPMPGNVKVKKEIREVINNVIASGISQEKIDKFVQAYESAYTLEGYEPSNVAARLGIGEYYYNDPLAAAKELEEYKKITSGDLKAVAAKYLSETALQFINIKPSF